MAEDRDFFEQLLNESYNPDKGLWVRVDTSTIPVDFRDCVRYARAAAEVYCNGQWVRIPATRPVVQETAAAREKRQAVIAGRKQDGDVAVGSDDGRKAGFIRRPSGGFFTRRR